MARNPLKKPEPEAVPEEEKQVQPASPPVQVVEREVNLGLINDKLNYLTGVTHKIAEACEVKLD